MGAIKHRYTLYILGAIVLLFGAFFNWYPFFTGDTSVYINSGFENYVPDERPVFYGWFLRFSSLGFSLWLTAFIQCLILSYLIIRLIRTVIPSSKPMMYLIILMSIGLISGVWWESSKLIPDIFSPILSLSLLLLFFSQNSKGQTIILFILIWLSSIVHLSHLAILLALTILIWIFNFNKLRTQRTFRFLNVVVILSFLSIFLSNFFLEGRFQLARGNSVFLMGKLNESGILNRYLDEHCDDAKYKICAYKDSLPATAWQFVWEKDGAVMKTGGWQENEEEFSQIIRDVVSSPSYYPIIIYKSVLASGVQLAQMQVGDNLFRQEKESNSIQSITKYYPHEKNAALWTKQFLIELPFKQMSWFYILLIFLSLIWLLYTYQLGKISPIFFKIFLFVILLIVLNAFVTANLANIAARLNARMIWLIPAMICIEFFRIKLAYQSEAE